MGDQFSGEAIDFRTLINYIDGVALWIVSEAGRFDYASTGIEDICGISAETIQEDPTRVLEGIHPDDREQVRSFMEQPPDQVTEES